MQHFIRSAVTLSVILQMFHLPLFADEWQTLKNCRLLPNESNDGDSFHVRHDGKEYIFRLYFVDTPESEMQVPDRVRDQGAYFGTSEAGVLNVGRYSKQVTAQILSEPFWVLTRFQDARGRSALGRSYAFVMTSDRDDLAETLVGAGLARSYGAVAAPPGQDVSSLRAKYDALEAAARRHKVGIFSPDPAKRIVVDRSKRSEPVSVAAAPEASPSPRTQTPESTSPSGLDIDPLSNVISSSVSLMQLPGVPEVVASETKKPDVKTLKPMATGAQINLNTATTAELEKLPGIGPKLAAAIIANRPFTFVEDLKRVTGIGASKATLLVPLICVE